ncbi:hypothetical protein JD969_05330 [Planctomycetota bacterium]|nr:hypothetical protein JD969_05330 [Planctomycetota bacterium]
MRNHWHLVAVLGLIMVGIDVTLYSVASRIDGSEGPGEPKDSMPIMPGEGNGLYLDVDEMNHKQREMKPLA